MSDAIVMQQWSELLKKQRREMLIEHLLFTTGVTTLVAESGGGKTTLAMAVAMTVATGDMWGDKRIGQRPAFWVAGEGQYDLCPMYESWMECRPGCGQPAGGFYEEPIELANETETDKLIKMLEGLPPPLIITDALADMIGNGDESSARDINRVYRNIWRVVTSRGASFLIPHHSGWENERERGSTAIRAKSDIVVKIKLFDPSAGTMGLEHLKRRGGAKLKDFYLASRLIPVVGCPEPVPVIMGPQSTADAILSMPFGESDEVNARRLVKEVMLMHFPEGATHKELSAKSGMKGGTLQRAFNLARDQGWIAGGGGRGMKWTVNTDALGKGLPLVSGGNELPLIPTPGSLPLPPPKGGGFGGSDNPYHHYHGVGSDQVLVPIPGCIPETPQPDEEAARVLEAAKRALDRNRNL
jgi:hypothetical protein